MTFLPRHTQIVELVREHGPQTLEKLSERFGVTPQTLRRDVQRLAQAGYLTRFHGGVRLPSSTIENIHYRQRQTLSLDAKKRIAQEVARHVPNDCSLILNLGTTTEAIAQALKHHRGLRVITNNLNVAMLMGGYENCEVIVAPGQVRGSDLGVIGEATVDFIGQFKVDIGIIGISGIEADGTLRDFDYREVKVARSIIQQSREVWLAADASKFNRPAMVELARLTDIDMLFTDATPKEPFNTLLVQSEVVCVIAADSQSQSVATP